MHVGGPVQQLGGRDALRDQPEKRQLNVAAAEHRARAGMLETCGWVVERVVGGKLGRMPRCSSSCCGCPIHSAPVAGAALPKSIRAFLLKKALRIQSTHPGGRNAANSSVTRYRESVKRYSAAGRPPLRPDRAVVPVRVMTVRRSSTR